VDQLLGEIRKPESNARLRRLTDLYVVVAILVMGTLGIFSFRISQGAAENAAWVGHTYSVIAELELILRNLDDVETGARGFALSGQDRFLDPYRSGLNATLSDLEMLRTLTRDNAGQEQRRDVLAEQIRMRLEAAADLVKARRHLAKLPDVLGTANTQ
jgi:methyl-accepting chemotaxis protein